MRAEAIHGCVGRYASDLPSSLSTVQYYILPRMYMSFILYRLESIEYHCLHLVPTYQILLHPLLQKH